jgi:peptide deformylase
MIFKNSDFLQLQQVEPYTRAIIKKIKIKYSDELEQKTLTELDEGAERIIQHAADIKEGLNVLHEIFFRIN